MGTSKRPHPCATSRPHRHPNKRARSRTGRCHIDRRSCSHMRSPARLMDILPRIRTARPDKTHHLPHRDHADSDLEEFRHGPHHSAPRSTRPTAEAGHFTSRRPGARRRTSPTHPEWSTHSRTATGPPRPPRELPKASSKRRAPTEPRTVATERAQYGHPTVPALDLTATVAQPAAGRPARPRRTSPRRRCAVNSNPPPHQDQKAQQRASSWPEGNPEQPSPTKTDRKMPRSSERSEPQLPAHLVTRGNTT